MYEKTELKKMNEYIAKHFAKEKKCDCKKNDEGICFDCAEIIWYARSRFSDYVLSEREKKIIDSI